MCRLPLNKFSLLIILYSIFFLCRFAYAQPKIFFEEVIFDAGEVEQGTEVGKWSKVQKWSMFLVS